MDQEVCKDYIIANVGFRTAKDILSTKLTEQNVCINLNFIHKLIAQPFTDRSENDTHNI